jgi:hypothetical protein
MFKFEKSLQIWLNQTWGKGQAQTKTQPNLIMKTK